MSILQFCEEQINRENYIGEIRGEMKDAIAQYAEANNLTQKSVKKAYAVFKELRKDRTETEIVEREREQLIESMMGANDEPTIQ